MKLLFSIFIFFSPGLLFAQQEKSSNDIDFIEKKITTVYAGYKDKITPAEFAKQVKAVRALSVKDSFSLLSKLTLLFNDQHLSLYQLKRNKDADTAVCAKNYAAVLKAASVKRKNGYEGFWINDKNSLVIYLKKTGRDRYEGFVAEANNNVLPGYCIIKMQPGSNGKRITDYTDTKGQFRVFVQSWFKNSTTLINGSFAKWFRVTDYQKGMLAQKKAFNDSAAVIPIDSDNVLIKMHDFSSRGIAKVYDSLIKKNSGQLAACKNLIIDIRGNAGGSIRNFIPLLPYICDRPVVRVGYYKLCSQDLIDEAVEDRKTYAQQNDTARVRAFDSAINRMEQNKNQFVYNVADTLFCNPVNSRIKNVGLITDYGCRSAAELMILHFKQIKKVTTFGEKTAGAIDYLDISSYRLPQTNYILWVATTKRETTPKEPSYDATGIQPDISISDSTPDWVNFVKRYYE